MSDGSDPQHGPYRGKSQVDLDLWVHELTYTLIKMGAVSSGTPVHRVTTELKTFTEQVIRATRDGHFKEVT